MEAFFVIGGKAKRTKHDGEAAAIEFAKKLIAQHDADAGKKYKTQALDSPPFYVVKLVKVVEKVSPPVVIREPVDADFAAPSVVKEED